MGTRHDWTHAQNNGVVRILPRPVTRRKIRLTSGEPYTLRGVSTVRMGAFGNLSQKCGKASGAYPTLDDDYGRVRHFIILRYSKLYHADNWIDIEFYIVIYIKYAIISIIAYCVCIV